MQYLVEHWPSHAMEKAQHPELGEAGPVQSEQGSLPIHSMGGVGVLTPQGCLRLGPATCPRSGRFVQALYWCDMLLASGRAAGSS